jgi:uncharacterized protein (DUF4415 family)
MKNISTPATLPKRKGIKISDEARRLYEQRDRRLDNDPDCAPLPPEKWANAMTADEYREFRRIYRPLKKLTSVRIDADIIDWLKSKGEGHLTKINDILRERMTAERMTDTIVTAPKPGRRKAG